MVPSFVGFDSRPCSTKTRGYTWVHHTPSAAVFAAFYLHTHNNLLEHLRIVFGDSKGTRGLNSL